MGKYTISLTGGRNTKAHSVATIGGRTTKSHNIADAGGKNTVNHKIHPKLNSFAEIQSVVKAGLAKEYFDIGQELMTHYTYEGTVYDMPWVVLDNDRECIWRDESRHPGLWIGSKYATIEDIQFDAPEQEEATEATAQDGLYYCGRNANTYTMLNLSAGDTIPYSDYEHVYHNIVNHQHVFQDGYSRYAHCAIRQWLNSDATFDEWWTAQHVGDCPPSDLATKKGFMAGLDSDFLAVVNPVKIQVATSTITDGDVTDVMYDMFFLQSVEELYGKPYVNVNDIEGPYFPYWKQITGLVSPTNGSKGNKNDAREIRRINDPSGSASTVSLRSESGSASTWYMSLGGYLSSGRSAYISSAVLSACVIS